MKVWTQRRWWFGLFGLLFLASLHWGDVTTVQRSWFGFPRFVWWFVSLQMLLALALLGFSTWVWEPEAEQAEEEPEAEQAEEISKQSSGGGNP